MRDTFIVLPLVFATLIAAWPFPAHACTARGETREDEHLARDACDCSRSELPPFYYRLVLGAKSSQRRLLLTIDPNLAGYLRGHERTTREWLTSLLALRNGPSRVVICIERNLDREPFMAAPRSWPLVMDPAEENDCL